MKNYDISIVSKFAKITGAVMQLFLWEESVDYV